MTGKAKHAGGDDQANRSSLRKSIRDTERLLKRETLPADVRVAAERKLKALQVQLEGTSNKLVERVSQQRYRMVRFFERKKVARKIATVERKLAAISDDDAAAEALRAQLKEHAVELHYTDHFPKEYRYIALMPTTPTTDVRVIAARDAVLEQIRDARDRGTIDSLVIRIPPNTIRRLVNPQLRAKKSGKGDSDADDSEEEGEEEEEEEEEGDEEQSEGSPAPKERKPKKADKETATPEKSAKKKKTEAAKVEADAESPKPKAKSSEKAKAEQPAKKDKKRKADDAPPKQDDFFTSEPTELPATERRQQYIVVDEVADNAMYGSRRSWNEQKKTHTLNHRGDVRKSARKFLPSATGQIMGPGAHEQRQSYTPTHHRSETVHKTPRRFMPSATGQIITPIAGAAPLNKKIRFDE